MTDLTEVMLNIVGMLGLFTLGHAIGYHRGKVLFEEKYKECIRWMGKKR